MFIETFGNMERLHGEGTSGDDLWKHFLEMFGNMERLHGEGTSCLTIVCYVSQSAMFLRALFYYTATSIYTGGVKSCTFIDMLADARQLWVI